MGETSPSKPIPIKLDLPAVESFCRRHHVIRLSLFGSTARGQMKPDSDLDLLYVFDPDHVPGWEFGLIADELEQLLGRPIDLLSELSLPPHLREEAQRDRIVLFDTERQPESTRGAA